MLTFRRYAVQAGLAFAVLIAANYAVQVLAKGSVPRQTLRRAKSSPPATELFLGNSLTAAAIDEAAFRSSKPGRPLNLGIGFTSPVEHALLSRRLTKHRGAAVYYGFFDTQLTDPPSGGWGELFGNRAMAYYVEPGAAVEFYTPDSPWRAVLFRLAGRIPMFVDRAAIWGKVELLRRRLAGLGMPAEKMNQFGRAADFALLESEEDGFARRCRTAASAQIPLSAPVADLFQRVRDWDSALYVIEMPMTADHRERYYDGPAWNAYRGLLKRRVREVGGIYIPAADWVEDRGFSDNLHLNADGAKAFSVRLAQWASQRDGE